MISATVRVNNQDDLEHAVAALALGGPRPTLALVGGAAGMSPATRRQVEALFATTVVPTLEVLGAAVVDGGTDAGIMAAMGSGHRSCAATFPLIGVVTKRGTNRLEPNHSHILVVPGQSWGDEVPWLAAVATLIASGAPSVTLLINGGDIAWRDVGESLARSRPVIALVGTGRTADALGTAIDRAGHETSDHFAASGLLTTVSLADRAGLSRALRAALSNGS